MYFRCVNKSLKTKDMKVLKWIGIILLVIIVLVIVVSLFLPKEYKYETKIVIKAPVSSVYEEVNNLKNWRKWDPWIARDTNAIETFSGSETGAGQVREWKSEVKSVGNGKMEIVESEENSYQKNALYFAGSDEPTYSEWFFVETDEGTEVTWKMEFSMGFNPVKIIWSKAMESNMKTSFNTGLENLKKLVEAKPIEEVFEPELGDISEMVVLCVKDSCSIDENPEIMHKRLQELNNFAKEKELDIKDKYMVRYLVWNIKQGYTIFETMRLVGINSEVEDEVFYLDTIPAGKSVEVSFRGDYEDEKFMKAHTALGEFIMLNNLEMSGYPFEDYLFGPHNSDDPNNYFTKIIYPVMEKAEAPMAEEELE
jgi:effector-binding domain-containing protein